MNEEKLLICPLLAIAEAISQRVNPFCRKDNCALWYKRMQCCSLHKADAERDIFWDVVKSALNDYEPESIKTAP